MTKFKKKTRFSLDDKIQNSKFNYCKNLKWFLIAPIAIVLVGIIILSTLGFNLGIDFTGGSNMTIFVDKDQSYSATESFDIDKDMKKLENVVSGVLSNHGLKITTIQTTSMDVRDLGIEDGDAIIVKYQNDNSLETEQIEKVNEEIKLELLKAFGFVDNSVSLENLESEANAGLVANGGITTASASAELMMKSFISLLVAVAIILIYVAIRFELTSGLAAILALFHDILVTTAIVLICRIQINVAFIAALITILGYSINNTIIIFDKMREDRKVKEKANEKIDNVSLANNAVKQTMTRSVLTALTTFVSILMITIIGVPDIRQFAFPIMIGILSGFYSSVFITPGLWAIAYRPKKRKKISQKPQTAEVEQ